MYNRLHKYFAEFTYSCFIITLFSGLLFSHTQAKNNDSIIWFRQGGVSHISTIFEGNENKYLFKRPAYAYHLRFGRTTIGKQAWESHYNYPNYGFGIRYTTRNNPYIGDETSPFIYIQVPFANIADFSFSYYISAGISICDHWFNPLTNFNNIYIGSKINANIEFKLAMDYPITDQLDLYTAASFTHTSNGALAYPNLGLNTLSITLGSRFYFNKKIDRKTIIPHEFPKHKVYNELYAQFSGGLAQSKYNYQYYGFANILLGYSRQFSEVARFGAGLEFMYNSTLRSYPMITSNTKEHLFMNQAAYLSYEWQYGQFAIPITLAMYIHRGFNFNDLIYEKIGIKYYINKFKSQYFSIGIKAHMANADYIEWSFGTTLWKF